MLFWQENNMEKEFNILISGVGGQGLLTLLRILGEAALAEGYDLKSAETHGLSQRGGSVNVHFRFGKKIFSPQIPAAKANLIISLEAQEVFSTLSFAYPLRRQKLSFEPSKETIFLINDLILPIPERKNLSSEEVLKTFQKFSKNVHLIPASKICQKEFQNDVTAGIFLLSFAVYKKFIPLKENSIMSALKKVLSEKYLEINFKTFELAKNYAQKYTQKTIS